MAWKTRLLVVANRTADSDDLLAALRERSTRGPIAVTFVVPQDSHGGLGERMTAALARCNDRFRAVPFLAFSIKVAVDRIRSQSPAQRE